MSSSFRLLVISHPAAPYLRHLTRLPDSVDLTVGNQLEMFQDAAAEAGAVLNCFLGGEILRAILPRAPKLEWIHSLPVGVDSLLFPELVESPVPLTNSRGIFAEALGEFTLGAMLYFAKDLRRMVRQQQERNFEAFDVRMLSGKTLGIVGYGSIGRACAWRAKAMGMRVLAVRRRPELSEGDANVDATYSPDRRREMLAECDYVAVAGALTPETRGMIGAAEFAAMKREAVLINVGRGPVVVESALVEALGSGAIRGAALDVFDTEPLPQDHPFWGMENVLLSPHCADHNETWLDDAMECFLDNFQRFRDGAPLANVVDKRAGY